MDEGYFLYFEDTEYCLRARRAGWTFALAPQATARHHQGGSGPVESSISQRRRLPAYYYRSRSRYFAQTYGRAGLIAANLMWYLGRAVALLRPLAGRSVPRAIESEARDIWTSALSPLGDRPASDPRRI